MERLIQAGLFGKGLTDVNSPRLVELYNICLKEIGLEPTGLKSFRIDGWGWSPDIAAERKNPFYLSHDVADSFAIILTPDQYNQPVYFPYHSFDRRLMKFIFDSARAQINNLTTRTGIWLDIDQEVDHYLDPDDLLMVDSISVKFHSIGHLMSGARRQRELVRKFKETGNAWSNSILMQEIIESAKGVGDLRYKNIVIQDIAFNDVKSFYTRAFGGVYVLRELKNSEFLLIVEDKTVSGNVDIKKDSIFYLKDPSLIEKLLGENLVEINLDWYRENKDRLQYLLNCIFIESIARINPDIDLGSLNSAKIKQTVNQLYIQDQLPDLYHKIRKLMRKLVPSHRNNIKLSKDLELMLLRPAGHLSESLKEVIWHLLVKINPMDVYRQYCYDKEGFFRQYEVWPELKRKWWVEFLKEHYVPKMDQYQ